MSKILKANETGYGLMIENDAGFIAYKDNISILKEELDFKNIIDNPILINCILQKWGVKNKNGRIYPKEVLISQVNQYQNLINDNSATSEADHPDSSTISLHNISHLITKVWWGTGEQENILYGQLRLIVTRGYLEQGIVSVIGDKILLYLQHKIKLGISSRGVGSLKEIRGENIVQDDFELIGFDLVSSPSTPGAWLMPSKEDLLFKEGKEGILLRDNSIILAENNNIVSAFDRFLM